MKMTRGKSKKSTKPKVEKINKIDKPLNYRPHRYQRTIKKREQLYATNLIA